MQIAGPLLAALALAILLYVPGWAVARALRAPGDTFTRVWLGMASLSLTGLLLAQGGRFSLVALVGALGALTMLALAIARWRGGPTPLDAAVTPGTWCGRVACLAGLTMMFWCWPSFETVLGALDSTMYVSAGIHLAQTGTLVLEDSTISLLPIELARTIFPSVALQGQGPFIRLPGGLLMPTLGATTAVPAFFPLLPVWVAVLVALGGAIPGIEPRDAAALAPALAPLFAGLALWSTVLFAGEALGLLAAAITALLLASNFALWWYGRFLMSETMTWTFLWGGLVVLARIAHRSDPTETPLATMTSAGRRVPEAANGAAFAAGVLLGLAGLARSETFAFLTVAGALWLSWTRARVPVLPLIGGFALMAIIATVLLATAPSHHLAYLRNDFAFFMLGLAQGHPQVWRARTLLVGTLAGALLMCTGGWLGRRGGVRFAVGAGRVLVIVAALMALIAYAQLAGRVRPLRSLAWLAVYCPPLEIALGVAGLVVCWRSRHAGLRLATLLVLVVVAVTFDNPRVAPYQTWWAIRRFLPVVIPGLTIGAAALLAWIAAPRRPSRGLLAIAATATVTVLSLRPIIAAREQPYYAGAFAAIATLANRLPPHALVLIDSGFADVQIQVPLWLWKGRETVMMQGGSRRWRQILRALVASGRPVYWIANRYDPTPTAERLSFRVLEPDPEFTVAFPEAPTDTPPRRAIRRVVSLRAYEVGEGFASDGSGMKSGGSGVTSGVGDVQGVSLGSAPGATP